MTAYKETTRALACAISFIQLNIINRLVTQQNQRRLFFLRGIYPFYLLAVAAVTLFFFYALTHTEKDDFRSRFFTSCLVLKTVLAVAIPWNDGKKCEVVKEFE